MCKNRETSNIWSMLSQIPKLFKSEVTTTFGRVNLISDLLLVAVVIAIFAVSTFERVALVLASIWNQTLVEHLSNADPLIAFIILVLFFVICLIFVCICEKIIPQTKA